MIYLSLILKLIIGFTITILHLNYSGKTQMSQMNAIDLIGNFILGGIIGGVIYNNDITYTTYLTSLLIGILLINLINWGVKKTPLLKKFTVGNPILLVYNGKFLIDAIKNKKNKINIDAISSTLRIMGHSSFASIDFLQIEPNGQLSIITKDEKKPAPSIILVMNGTVDSTELKNIGKDENWLRASLNDLHIDSYDQIYLIEYYNKKLNIILEDGTVIQN